MQQLQEYRWPGNVRELRNVVERSLLFATSDVIDAVAVKSALPTRGSAESAANGTVAAGTGPLADRVTAFEREMILAELKRNQNHITNAAKALGLERSHLYKKCQQVGIDLQALRSAD